MANLHLLSNHFPILGSLFGVLLLVVALVKPNLNTTLSAYLILLVSGFGGIIAYFSGEAAEERIEHIKGISHKVIHIHEEMAENSLIFIFLLTATAVVGLWAERAQWESKKKNRTLCTHYRHYCFCSFCIYRLPRWAYQTWRIIPI